MSSQPIILLGHIPHERIVFRSRESNTTGSFHMNLIGVRQWLWRFWVTNETVREDFSFEQE
jgi:hypothetical protein